MMTQGTLPLENFIQAVQSQLDKAQSAMAVKARNLNLPMTFAIKDIVLDLRAHVEFTAGEIRIRPAAANETEASVFHIVFAAITRPMIEENAAAFSEDPEDQPIDALEDELTEEERRKLEWVGVRTVKKLREVERTGSSREIGRVTNLPVSRLRQALRRAAAPMIDQVTPIDLRPGDGEDFRRILRVRGRNLTPDAAPPEVTVGGRALAILRATPEELLLAPDDDQWAGELRIDAGPELASTMSFDLRTLVRPAPTNGARHAPTNGVGQREEDHG
jgi:hypothetical protein